MKVFLTFILLSIITINASASSVLQAGDIISCTQVDGPRSYKIELVAMNESTHEGHARVTARKGNGQTPRHFSGVNAQYEEFRDKLGVQLRANGSIVETILFWDSIVFREVDGDLTFNNGKSVPLRCRLTN